jgi:hypothetical protein
MDAMPLTNLKPEEEDAILDEDRLYRTTYMFSATMPAAVERLARKYMRKVWMSTQVWTWGRAWPPSWESRLGSRLGRAWGRARGRAWGRAWGHGSRLGPRVAPGVAPGHPVPPRLCVRARVRSSGCVRGWLCAWLCTCTADPYQYQVASRSSQMSGAAPTRAVYIIRGFTQTVISYPSSCVRRSSWSTSGGRARRPKT